MKQNNSKSIMAIDKNKNKYDKSNIELKQTNEILYYKSKIKKNYFILIMESLI